MIAPDTIQNLVVKQLADFRAEIIVAELLELGLSLNQISVLPLGTFERGFRRDVLAVEENETGEENHTTLLVSREGLYDMLPQGVFHQVQDRNPFKSPEQMVQEIKIQKEEEHNARTFFAVLEAEFNRQRIMVELTERKLLLEASSPYNHQLFSQIWGEAPFLSVFQQTVLLHLLPVAHQIVGKYAVTAQCIGLLISEQVEINLEDAGAFEIPEYLLPILGNVQLGVDLALGVKPDDSILGIHITVGPVRRKNIGKYLDQSKYKEEVLNYLYGFFLPAEATVRTSILVEEEAQEFKFAEQDKPNYLSYTTYI